MINPSVSFILASASPRRAELLTAAGFAFDIVPADIDETPLTGEPAEDYALRVARAKAERGLAAIVEPTGSSLLRTPSSSRASG